MKISVRLKAAWRAFKNPCAGSIGFLHGPPWGFVGSPIIGDVVDPKEIIKPGKLRIKAH